MDDFWKYFTFAEKAKKLDTLEKYEMYKQTCLRTFT